MHPWFFFWQKIQNSTFLQIGAWNLHSEVLWYAEPISFFSFSITIEPGGSLLTVRYHELFDQQTPF